MIFLLIELYCRLIYNVSVLEGGQGGQSELREYLREQRQQDRELVLEHQQWKRVQDETFVRLQSQHQRQIRHDIWIIGVMICTISLMAVCINMFTTMPLFSAHSNLSPPLLCSSPSILTGIQTTSILQASPLSPSPSPSHPFSTSSSSYSSFTPLNGVQSAFEHVSQENLRHKRAISQEKFRHKQGISQENLRLKQGISQENLHHEQAIKFEDRRHYTIMMELYSKLEAHHRWDFEEVHHDDGKGDSHGS